MLKAVLVLIGAPSVSKTLYLDVSFTLSPIYQTIVPVLVLSHYMMICAVFVSEGYSSYNHGYNERLTHGRQLKIHLLEKAEKLEFIPVNNPADRLMYWTKSMSR